MKNSLMIFITLLLLLSSCTPAPQEPARVESLSSTSAIISTGVMTETPKNEAVTGSSETPLPEYLWHELTGTGLEFVKVLDDNSAYTRYQIYYLSDGLRISGIMNIPKGDGTLLTLSFPREEHLEADNKKDTTIDIRGTIRIIAGISGLFAMIFFAMMNNFIGGIFMSLMDAYSLSLVSVETWGVILAFTSTGFILSGLMIARTGLGRNPVKTLLLLSLVSWLICMGFTVIPSIILTGIGMFLWMMIGPAAEACEQTVLQKVVPLERQGRVFGFGQSMENIASPLTAFMVGPLTQFLVIPWLASPAGEEIFGGWWGTTPDRAMAIIFVCAGLFGFIVTLIAFSTKSYRALSKSYLREVLIQRD